MNPDMPDPHGFPMDRPGEDMEGTDPVGRRFTEVKRDPTSSPPDDKTTERAEDVDLPRVSPYVVNVIADMLLEHTDQPRRRPTKTAALLALLCELHKQGRPLPPRDEVAKKTGITVPTIDAALSSKMGEGMLRMRIETPAGRVERRPSVVRQRYYIPNDKLMRVYDTACKEDAKLQASTAFLRNRKLGGA